MSGRSVSYWDYSPKQILDEIDAPKVQIGESSKIIGLAAVAWLVQALDLWSLATEGTQEWPKESAIILT